MSAADHAAMQAAGRARTVRVNSPRTMKKSAEKTDAPSARPAAPGPRPFPPGTPKTSARPPRMSPSAPAVGQPGGPRPATHDASATHTGATNTSRTTAAAGARDSASNSPRPAAAKAAPATPPVARSRGRTRWPRVRAQRRLRTRAATSRRTPSREAGVEPSSYARRASTDTVPNAIAAASTGAAPGTAPTLPACAAARIRRSRGSWDET
jgi:hypothetical protein